MDATNVGIPEMYEVHRNLSVPLLSSSYIRILYAIEITNFLIKWTLIRTLTMAILSLFLIHRQVFVLLSFFWKHLQSATGKNAARWYQLNNFKTMPLGCVGISRTNEEADGFIKLLTQDQVEQELITWDWMNCWGWL